MAKKAVKKSNNFMSKEISDAGITLVIVFCTIIGLLVGWLLGSCI